MNATEAVELARTILGQRDEYEVAKTLIDLISKAEIKGFEDAAAIAGTDL